ncbi:5-oxoprolinase subunit C family protein [Lysobacter fragariae]
MTTHPALQQPTPGMDVLAPGLLTTVQDLGRHGWRHVGVAGGGVLDAGNAALANWLVGNDKGAALLELTLQGPTLGFDRPARIALTGANVSASFTAASGGDFVVHKGRPVDLPAGTLRLGAVHGGARAWLALAGGIDVPAVLGSRSTDLRGGFGGWQGRALRAGDRVPLIARAIECTQPRMPGWWFDPSEGAANAPIHYVPSAHPAALKLAQQAWQASARSNRQGVRLEGTALHVDAEEQISAAVAPGTIQLPPGGLPIVLLADAQTVGGYPRLGHVISADLHRLAQLRPGETVRFESCDARTATQLACAARARLARIAVMIHHHLNRGNRE